MSSSAARTRPTRHGLVGTCRLVGVLAIAIAGCASYEPRPLDPQRSLTEFSARRLDSAAMHDAVELLLPSATASWPPLAWDRAQLLAVGLASNRKLEVARAQVQVALAHEISAGETRNPDLTLQSEYARHDPHPWLYGLGLDFLLRSPERKRLEIEFSQLQTSNARWQLLDQVWAVRHALIAALSDREEARQRLDLLQHLAAAQDDLAVIEEERVAAGEDTPADLIVARQARMEITQQQAEARMSMAAAQAALGAALGLPQAALDQAAVSWPDWGAPPAPDRDKLRESREQALLSRSDLAAAIGEYAQAENKLRQAIAQQYPQFQLSPGYYWDHGIAKFPFDVGFTLPLFNRSQGEIAEARAAREVAGQHLLAVQTDIDGDISAAESAEHIARDSATVAARQLTAAQRQREQMELGLRLGAVGGEERIGAEVMVLRAELAWLQSRARLQNARNALEDALRVPLSGPELALAKSSARTDVETSR
ncbi:MAG: TolC family protein [Rudaea sp.]|nr:TolC family protein [Rudaea sp.]